jgi:hypothetical protein
MSAVQYFLLEYRRSSGVLERAENVGTDPDKALRLRFLCEMHHKDDSDLEVVLLSAPSLDALKQTHSRYFKTDSELRQDLLTATSS